MSKKLIIVVLVLAVLGAGGFLLYQQIQSVQKQQTYEASPDRPINDYLNALKANNAKASMKDFSSFLLEDYSEEYWKTTIFAEAGGFAEWPELKSKGAVQPLSPDVPNRYDPQLNQQATEYLYDFKVNNATYRLLLVVFRHENAWKINEVSGRYLP